VFTSETKKAGSDRETPVNHIGYLRIFIYKTHVVTSVKMLYEWGYLCKFAHWRSMLDGQGNRSRKYFKHRSASSIYR